jgi:hypothetical protein
VCEDNVECTLNGCDGENGCTYTPSNNPCDDADACTDDSCDLAAGCEYTPVVCDDNVECTLNGCDAASGCIFTTTTNPCDDGDPCTNDDLCSAAGCKGTEMCDDGIDCTTDSCDASNGGACVFVPSDNSCDDGLYCNGTEICAAGMGCQPGDPVECDDEQTCTEDSCDEVEKKCIYTPVPGKCICEGVPTSYSFTFDKSVGDKKINCPIVGGVAGFSMGAAIKVTTNAPHCANGCQSSLGAEGRIYASLDLCKESLSVEGTAYLNGGAKSCLTCDKDTCKQSCEGGTCDTYDFGGTAKLIYSKFYGYHQVARSAGVAIETKCGLTLKGIPSVSLNGKKTSNEGYECDTCTECLSGDGTLGFDVSGDAGCKIDLDLFDGWYKKTIGCDSCGHLGLGVYGGVQGQTGDCGGKICAFAGAKAKASASTPSVSMGVGWFGVSVQCTVTGSACAEANGCGNCTGNCSKCADASVGASCNVSGSLSL